ncbi:MAG: hypothetical protein U5J98_11160 [Halobacteriales archaeon]|nr:hypothetical protein [Halobacteriales archaeon]
MDVLQHRLPDQIVHIVAEHALTDGLWYSISPASSMMLMTSAEWLTSSWYRLTRAASS